MMTVAMMVLAVVVVQRLVELVLARRNTRRLMTEGAMEVGCRHYPLFVVLHAAWLAATAIAIVPSASPQPVLLAGLAVTAAARLWVMSSLGRRWTTRVVTVPGEKLIRRGPYRWLRHPNYLVVSAEIALLPLAFGAWQVAVTFSALNGALLAHRVAIEDRVLTAPGSSAASG